MYSASADSTVKMWDLAGRNKFTNIIKHSKSCAALDLSSDGNYLMSGSLDGSAYILNFEGKNYKEIGHIVTDSEIWAVKISPKLEFVVTGDDSGVIIA